MAERRLSAKIATSLTFPFALFVRLPNHTGVFTAGSIDEALKELELRFQREHRALEEQYQHDRQALLNARDVAMRFSGINGSSATIPDRRLGILTPQPVVVTASKKGRKDRDLVREVAMSMTPEFSVRDMIEAARQHQDEAIRTLDDSTIHSTVSWFKKHRLIEVVRERQSKTEGAVYRLVSPDLKRPAIVSRRNSKFPLLDMALEAINSLSIPAFGRAEVFDRLKEKFPQYAERIKIDSVGATLVKLGASGKIRCAAKDHHGNTYEKL